MRPDRLRTRVMVALLGPVLVGQGMADGHPLGNDSITHFSVLYVLPDQFRVDYLLDIAETPSGVIRRDEIDANHDDDDTVEEQTAWLDRKAADFAQLLKATLDGEPLVLEPLKEVYDPKTGQKAAASRMILKMPGFGGMPTYRVLIGYGGSYPKPLGGREHVLQYIDETFDTVSGLRRMLLEETSIGTMTAVRFGELREGPPSETLRELCRKRNVLLSDRAMLKSAGPDQFALVDGEHCWALANTDEGLGLFRSPYIDIRPPRPSYWNEGLDPFLYEQYDPSDLPQEKSATIRFTLRSPCPGTQPAPAVAEVTPPAATRPSGAGEPLPPFVEKWTDPRNNPAKTSQYYRQADTLVGLLRQFGQGRGFLLFLTITFLAFTWGAGHALMPGHAKTVVAAYLISQRGNWWHAVVLALIVTITHTALVVVVGLIIYFYQQSHPDLGPRIQLWLGTIAGVLVAAMGVTLIWRAVTGRIVHHHHEHDHHDHEPRSWWRRLFTHSHAHPPGHDHAHDHPGHEHSAHAHHHHHHEHGHTHDHAHPHEHHGHAHGPHAHDHSQSPQEGHGHADGHGHDHTHEHAAGHAHSHEHVTVGARGGPSAEPISTRMLLLLGITGGIVPCPTAMIILLLGIGANVVAWALYAVGVFSLGLALTLMVIGFAALASRRFATRLLSDAEHEEELSGTGRRVMFQFIPALSGLVVVALGCMIAANYLYTMRVGRPLFPWLG